MLKMVQTKVKVTFLPLYQILESCFTEEHSGSQKSPCNKRYCSAPVAKKLNVYQSHQDKLQGAPSQGSHVDSSVFWLLISHCSTVPNLQSVFYRNLRVEEGISIFMCPQCIRLCRGWHLWSYLFPRKSLQNEFFFLDQEAEDQRLHHSLKVTQLLTGSVA